jgi:hypothetical protein
LAKLLREEGNWNECEESEEIGDNEDGRPKGDTRCPYHILFDSGGIEEKAKESGGRALKTAPPC